MCSNESTETLDQWEARMAEARPLSRVKQVPFVEFVVNGHGQLLDPAVDVLDPPAQAMLVRQQAMGLNVGVVPKVGE